MVLRIFANRLRKYLHRIISPNQGAFVAGIWIAENTIVAQELVHKVLKYKDKYGLMLLKVELKKAYDTLDWRFLNLCLLTWGFSKMLDNS